MICNIFHKKGDCYLLQNILQNTDWSHSSLLRQAKNGLARPRNICHVLHICDIQTLLHDITYVVYHKAQRHAAYLELIQTCFCAWSYFHFVGSVFMGVRSHERSGAGKLWSAPQLFFLATVFVEIANSLTGETNTTDFYGGFRWTDFHVPFQSFEHHVCWRFFSDGLKPRSEPPSKLKRLSPKKASTQSIAQLTPLSGWTRNWRGVSPLSGHVPPGRQNGQCGTGAPAVGFVEFEDVEFLWLDMTLGYFRTTGQFGHCLFVMGTWCIVSYLNATLFVAVQNCQLFTEFCWLVPLNILRY